MRIGIHKLGFVSLKDFPLIDKNGMKTEVDLLLSAFIKFGYDAEYVDLSPDKVKDELTDKPYDIIFVFNGHQNSTSSLQVLKNYTKELNYILTDTRFVNLKTSQVDAIDNYFVQSPKITFGKLPTYNSNIHKLPVYEWAINNESGKVKNIPLTEKTSKLIFGGSMRNRRDKINDYIIGNKNVESFLKSEDDGYDRRLPAPIYKQLLAYYKYGLVITDKVDSELGNITWRYFEYIVNDVITFVDKKSDPYNLILPKGDFLYIESGGELNYKMAMIEEDKDLQEFIIKRQRRRMEANDYVGKTFIKSLLEGRELNNARQ